VKYLLGHDLGTSSNKGVLLAMDGELIAWTSVPYEVIRPNPGWAEQDPHVWWDAICETTKRLVAQADINPTEVAAMSFSGQMQATLPVDRDGNPLSNSIIGLDTRAEPQSRDAVQGRFRVQGYGVRRLLKWLWLTNGVPTRSGRDPVAHILWIKEERPDIWEQTHKFLDAKDWLLFKSTGRYVTSHDTGHTTWLMKSRSGRFEWSSELMEMLGIPRRKMPNLVAGTDVVGPLTARAATQLGLPPSIPVVAGAGDILASAIGTGAVRHYGVHLSIGTSAWVSTHVPGRVKDLLSYTASICAANPDRQMLVAHQEAAGVCLEWIAALLSGVGRPLSYEALEELALDSIPGANGLFHLPWVVGEDAPVDDPWARGGFANLALHHSQEDMVRSVYEGVALNARWALTGVEKLMGQPAALLRFGGGGAASEFWGQTVADVCQRPVLRFEHPKFSGARGAALLAAFALGEIPDFDEIAAHVPTLGRLEPDRALARVYDEKFKLFVDHYRSNRGWFKRANAG